ncbi:MAG: hypothetical protein QOE90_1732 [Thermoplasmata archaeon]|nr:hypothetical protein [Thermoplasmata archaeon]
MVVNIAGAPYRALASSGTFPDSGGFVVLVVPFSSTEAARLFLRTLPAGGE